MIIANLKKEKKMNSDIMAGKWKEIKGEIRNVWGDITGDELEKSKGNMTSISGLIQKKYGLKKEEVSHKLDGIMARFGQTTEDIKESVANSTEAVKKDLKKNNV
jgi:uncharacterized protein YjbJ (UPF0337 family)